jgi:Holliday junction resolvase YEN1
MSQCANAFQSGAANGGPRADLLALFYKLARLLRAPVQVIFVFDGPERASMKRGHKVWTKPHVLTADLQWLLECFGFSWYTVSSSKKN